MITIERRSVLAAAASIVLFCTDTSGYADYQSDLEAYNQAYQAFDIQARAYWSSIAEKRALRNGKRQRNERLSLADYVLTQPPIYTGPPKPKVPEVPPPPVKYVPVVADFLQCAKDEFDFVPERPANESEFKHAYARAARTAGLTRDQIVRIYAFEVGGNGTYDSQAGLENPNKPGAHAVSTAIGYNQLLNTNTIELLAEQGDEFIKALQRRAASSSKIRKDVLSRKIDVLRRMIETSQSVADDWYEHEKLANTPKGLGIHALNLDINVGPLLQVQNLATSLRFARSRNYTKPLTAAELEMMNLTGDNNGLDMIVMPTDFREKVPTANFFQRAGYQANPVATRNNVVGKLFAAMNSEMDEESKSAGAKQLSSLFGR